MTPKKCAGTPEENFQHPHIKGWSTPIKKRKEETINKKERG